MAAFTLIFFTSRHSFQPLPLGRLSLFFRASCSLTPPACSSTRTAEFFFWKILSRKGLRDGWLRFQSQGIWASPSGSEGRRIFQISLRSTLPSFIPPKIININIFGLRSLQGCEWCMCEIPDEVAAPWEMTVNSKEQRWDVAAAAGKKTLMLPQNICQRAGQRETTLWWNRIRCSGASDPRRGGDTRCVTQRGGGRFLRSQTVWFGDEPLHTRFWNHLAEAAQRAGVSSQNSDEHQNVLSGPLKRLRLNCFDASRTFLLPGNRTDPSVYFYFFHQYDIKRCIATKMQQSIKRNI